MEPAHLSLPSAETLVAATLFLMTKHAAIRCPLVGRVIARQLQYLAEHPSETLTPQLRAVCAKLSAHWASEAAEMERARSRSGNENGGDSKLLH